VTKPGPSTAAHSGSSPAPQGGAASPKKGPQSAGAPARPEGTRVIAIANQKGGVGKSTTAVSLGASLADAGRRVLVLDLDPQGNASTGMGIRHDAREVSVYDVVVGEASIADAVVQTAVPNLWAIPSTIDLAGAEIELVSQFSRELRLRKALEPLTEATSYDYVLLDCPPSLGLLTINALAAALELIVPIQCEYYALEGLGQLLRNVSLVQQNINPNLQLTGIVMTMFDPRTKLSEQVVAEVKRYFGDRVYDVIIPRTVRLSEAPGFGQPITVYDPKSKGAQAYRRLAKEVDEKPPPSAPMPAMDHLPSVVIAAPADAEPSPTGAPASTTPRSPGPSTTPPPPPPAAPEPAAPTPSTPSGAPTPLRAAPKAVSDPARPAPTPRPAPTRAPAARRAEDPGDPPPPSPVVQVPAAGPDDDEAAAWLEELALEAEATATHASTEILAEAASQAESRTAGGEDEVWEDDASVPADPSAGPAEEARSGAGPGRSSDRRVVVIDDDIDIPVSAPLTQAPPGEPRTAGGRVGATLEDEGSPKKRWRLFRKGGE
jgi:chromosome partitioning protein